MGGKPSKSQGSSQAAIVEDKPQASSQPEGTPLTDEEKKKVPQRRNSVIDELVDLERTKSYNKIEEVANSVGGDVRSLSNKQKEELWDFYDKDGNGKLSLEEMKTVMRHLMRFRAKHASQQERKSIELRAMIMTPYQLEDFNEENLAKRVFDSLDVNHDGYVVKQEFIENFTLDAEACRVS